MLKNIMCAICFCFGLCLAGAETDNLLWNVLGLGIFSLIFVFEPVKRK